LILSNPLEEAVAESHRTHQQWPANVSDLDFSAPLCANYVNSIAVDCGTISITYGNRANGLIT